MRTQLGGGAQYDTAGGRARPSRAPEARPARRSVPLVLASDGGYAMQLATTLRSLVEANRSAWPLDVRVLCEGVSAEARRRVLESLPAGAASIRWLPVDLAPFGGYATPDHISKMTYARIVIPEALRDVDGRVLYLDADILVLDDLGPLWDVDLDGAVAGAVIDGLDAQIKADKPGLEALPRVRSYFNAGVLVIDLARWREERISERALEYLARYPLTLVCDQDALNVACDGLWKPLDARWNFQDHYRTAIGELGPGRRPAIVHFVTALKPWSPSSISVNAAFYDAFRSRTRFARTAPEVLRDVLLREGSRLRRVLRRIGPLRAAWRWVTGRGRGGRGRT